jgi:hypothetical protein
MDTLINALKLALGFILLVGGFSFMFVTLVGAITHWRTRWAALLLLTYILLMSIFVQVVIIGE